MARILYNLSVSTERFLDKDLYLVSVRVNVEEVRLPKLRAANILLGRVNQLMCRKNSLPRLRSEAFSRVLDLMKRIAMRKLIVPPSTYVALRRRLLEPKILR